MGKALIKRSVMFLLVIALSNSVFAYPVIVSNEGINHQEAKELVYSIPEKYYSYVDVVEFVNKPIKKFGLFYSAWYYAYWNKDHVCYSGKILIYPNKLHSPRDMLQHEIGHIYEHCVLKESISTEDYADEFIIK